MYFLDSSKKEEAAKLIVDVPEELEDITLEVGAVDVLTLHIETRFTNYSKLFVLLYSEISRFCSAECREGKQFNFSLESINFFIPRLNIIGRNCRQASFNVA